MTRPTLLRRAAAAAIGVDRRPSHARALPLAQGLTLTRRAAAAIIGIRAHRLPADATAEAAARKVGGESAGRSTRSAPSPLVTLGAAPGRPPVRERPHRGLVLAAAAAVTAVALGAYVHHEGGLSVAEQPPVHQPAGVLPKEYLGTWETTVENGEGLHTRKMVIRQGHVDETVMTLTAVGTKEGGGAYRCVFAARLDSVTSGVVRLSSSTVTSGKPPSACTPGGPSTLTLMGEDRLRRDDRDGTTPAQVYNRSR